MNDKVAFPEKLDLTGFLPKAERANEGDEDKLEYELFSVMVHSGGTFGGHYFAYIKSFEDGEWYNFNDSSVSEIQNSAEEIIKVFGGSASAYMLMYKRIDGNEKLFKFSDEEIPDYLKEEIQAETEKLIED